MHSIRGRSYFLLCTARSGSTSLARILDAASNGCCAVEPVPNLNVETRLAMDARLADRRRVVERILVPRVSEGLARHAVYGEKNVTYGPFVADMHALLGCRFVLLKRDGREVVRSLIDWHNTMFGTIYRECGETGELTSRALASAAQLPVHLDTSDFARPRPGPEDPLYEQWESLSRLEMCAYYWSTVSDLYLDALADVPTCDWIDIDYTHPTVDDVLRVSAFCGLTGIERGRVQEMLAARINSVQERTGQLPRSRRWPDWDGGERRRFERIAGDAMRRLGFFTTDGARWRPDGFGRCWHERAGDLAWFQWMFNSRRSIHDAAVDWIRSRDKTGDRIESVADFGCGLGVGYCEALADRRYVGFDLIPANVEWCRANRSNPRHEYHHLDFVVEGTPERYDLVISSGTIDNAWDVEAFLDAMIRASRRWIYLTCYRGWFPNLDEHAYSWSPEHACFYTDVSPQRVREHLEARSCQDICIRPLATGRTDIPSETLIVARVGA